MGKAKVKVKIEKIDRYKVPSYAKVKVVTMGNIVNIKYTKHRNDRATIQKIDNDRYMVLKSGEIREYEHTSNRSENAKGVKQSLNDLRACLNTNVIDVSKCRWVTLTYAENMTDTKQLYTDFKRFMEKYRKDLKKQGFEKVEYIIACEPQSRGAWHVHAVIMFDRKAPYIPNKVPRIYNDNLTWDENLKALKKHPDFNAPLLEKWGHGWVTIRPLINVDNVGAYLSAYMTDIKLDEARDSNMDITDYEVISKDIQCADGKQSKKFVKGARLSLYPTNFRLWRCSRGVKKPTIELMRNYEAQKKVSTAMLTYESSIQLVAEDDSFKNVIVNQYYNLIRKHSQESPIKVNESNTKNNNPDKKIKADELKKMREFFQQRKEESKVKEAIEIENNSHTHNGSKVQRLALIPDKVQGFKVKAINEMWVLPELSGKYSECAERLRAEYLFTQNSELHGASTDERNIILKNMQSTIENHLGTDYWLRMQV